jgi:O-antigen ligase
VTDTQKTYAIVGAAVVIGLVAWIALVLVPAWGSYSRLWDRFLATLLSIYVLAAFVLVGAGVGAVVLWYSDRL